MSKAILEFTLPEDQHEFQQTLKAPFMESALWSIAQEVFRPARKHGYPNDTLQNLILKINQLVQEHGSKDPTWPKDDYGPLDATDMIASLEKMFYEILNSEGISL